MESAIRVEGLSKRYRLIAGAARNSYRTLRDTLTSVFRPPARGTAREEFWALRDVSFAVRPGEVVGVIGRNGAGKSTLLKILSRIAAPTEGRVVLDGRVGSLLEVGTGFHPELSGRENVYLNGSILGMSRREIARKFDEIVAFSEVEKFLDTPVKRYSSGMYVRLAFAVAAHLEPEILIVDEVLAVGDTAFQRKCLNKMQDVATGGRTVLFVSHNMAAVQALCTRGVVMQAGRLEYEGSITSAVERYLRQLEDRSVVSLADRTDRRGKGPSRIRRLTVRRGAAPAGELVTGAPAGFDFAIADPVPGLRCWLMVYNAAAVQVASFVSDPWRGAAPAGGELVISCEIGELLLVPGRYRVNAAVRTDRDGMIDHVEAAVLVDVVGGLVGGRPVEEGTYGVYHQPHTWQGVGD